MKTESTTIHAGQRSTLASKQHNKDAPIIDLIHLMETVETTSQMAALNEVSMSDNNGGRIWF